VRGGARGGGTTYNVHFFPLNRSGALAGVFMRGRAYERMHGREYNGFGGYISTSQRGPSKVKKSCAWDLRLGSYHGLKAGGDRSGPRAPPRQSTWAPTPGGSLGCVGRDFSPLIRSRRKMPIP